MPARLDVVPYPEGVQGIEIALVIVAASGAVWALFRGAALRSERWAYGCVAVAMLGTQLYMVGAHWQVVPVYGGLALIGFLAVRRIRRAPRIFLASATLLLCGFTLLALWVAPVFRLPRPTGSFNVGTSGALYWTDTDRPASGQPGSGAGLREMVVQLWYPVTAGLRGTPARYARARELGPLRSYEAQIRTNALLDAPLATEGGQFPLLIFGPRWAGTRTQDSFLCEDLASHGYVVVAVDHPGNAARVQMGDGRVVRGDRAGALDHVESSSAMAIEALWDRELAIWVADDEFVLHKLKAENEARFNNRVDFERVGAFGHSFGGAASLRLLGLDPEVKAAVNLDGWTFGGLEHRTKEPVMMVYEGSGEARHPPVNVEGTLDTDDNARVDESLRRFGGLRAYVAGTQHMDFTDQTLLSPLSRLTSTGPIQGSRAREVTRGLVLGFFDSALRNDGSVPTFPEVRMETIAPAGEIAAPPEPTVRPAKRSARRSALPIPSTVPQ